MKFTYIIFGKSVQNLQQIRSPPLQNPTGLYCEGNNYNLLTESHKTHKYVRKKNVETLVVNRRTTMVYDITQFEQHEF